MDNLISFEIKETAYSQDTFIGSTVCKQITLEIINNGEYDLENKTIDVFVGEIISNREELIPYGSYLMAKPENKEVKGSSKYIGYDYMMKAEQTYIDENMYPISLYTFLSKACRNIGLTLGNTEIPNGSFMITGNAYTNAETYRQVFSEVAKCCGGFAKIGRDNKLYIVNLGNDSVETLSGNQYFDDFSKTDMYGPVNRVALALSYDIIGEDVVEEEPGISEDNVKEIRIAEIGFLKNVEDRTSVIGELFNTLDRLSYFPIKGKYYGCPYLDAGDKITIQTTKGQEITTYLLNHTFKYNGAFSGSLETPALSEVEKEYQLAKTLPSVLRKTELKVDKIAGEIVGIVEEQAEYEEKLSQLKIDVDGLSTQVKDVVDLTRTQSGLSPITIENCASGEIIEFRIMGNNVVFTTIFPENNLYPRTDIIPYESASIIKHTYIDSVTKEEVVKLYDLHVTRALRQFNEYYDEYVIKNGQGYELRRIQDDGTIVEDPPATNVQDLQIILGEGDNTFEVLNYGAFVYAKWVTRSDLTKVFTTQVEFETALTQTEKSIEALVAEKVDNDEIIAKLNLAVKDDKGIVELVGNSVTIDSDYFKLDEEGKIEATAGNIGDWEIVEGKLSSKYLILNPDGSDSGDWAVQVNPNKGQLQGYPAFGIQNNGTVYGYSFNVHAPADNSKPGQVYIFNTNGQTGTAISGGTIETAWIRCSMAMSSGGNNFVFKGYGMHGGHPGIQSSAATVDNNRYNCHWNGNKLDFFVNANYVGYATNDNGSDRRLKDDIKEIDENLFNALNEIEYKDYYFISDDNQYRHAGLIAQDVKSIFEKHNVDCDKYPFIYTIERMGPEGYCEYYTIDYLELDNYMLAYLKQTTKELTEENKKLNTKLEEQDELIQNLISRIEKLEKGE